MAVFPSLAHRFKIMDGWHSMFLSPSKPTLHLSAFASAAVLCTDKGALCVWRSECDRVTGMGTPPIWVPGLLVIALKKISKSSTASLAWSNSSEQLLRIVSQLSAVGTGCQNCVFQGTCGAVPGHDCSMVLPSDPEQGRLAAWCLYFGCCAMKCFYKNLLSWISEWLSRRLKCLSIQQMKQWCASCSALLVWRENSFLNLRLFSLSLALFFCSGVLNELSKCNWGWALFYTQAQNHSPDKPLLFLAP